MSRLVARAALAGALAGACALASCALASCAPGAFEWRIRFVNRADVMPTRLVSARVRRETCDGPIVWEGSVAQGRALEGMAVPALADGRYALDVVAYDAECRPVAERCVLVTAPFRDVVLVELASSPGPAACEPAACSDGVCDCSAGGCADAGPPRVDAAAGDAGPEEIDAHEVALTDGGPPDAFEAPDAYVVPPAPPVVIAPWNGATTGAPLTASSLEDPPLRPEFVWAPVSGAGSYRIELTRCDRAAWRTCALDAPTHVELVARGSTRARPSTDLPVSSVRPVGARYVFRVGACTTLDHRGCAYAEPRYLDVGRSSSDIDGDGTGDLLATAVSSTDAVLYDVQLGATPADMPTFRVQLTQPALGSLAAVGDYDGDGIAEVVVSAPSSEPTALGGRWLFLDDVPGGGLSAGGEGRSPVMGADLGARIVRLGDIDGDGYADFAVTAPGLGGEVRIQYGASTFDESLRTLLPRPMDLDEFGLDLCAAGDMNGDGRADVAVLTRGLDETTAAQVRIFSQRDAAVRSLRELPALTILVATGFAEFSPDGWKYLELECGGDVDGDGRPDIVIGQHRVDAVTVVTATERLIADSMGDGMGWDLGLGDLEGTGRTTVIASRPGLPIGRGYTPNGTAQLRYSGTTTTLELTPYDVATRLASAGSDYDGDGRDDVVLVSGADLRVRTADGAGTFDVSPPSGRSWRLVAY